MAVGPRAALPHARPGQKPIGEGDFVLVDWGADGGLYKSDLTRVLMTGKISPKLERVYRVVFSAQEAAIAAIRPGVKAQDVDSVARQIIAEAGFGTQFGHGWDMASVWKSTRRRDWPSIARRAAAGHGGHRRAGDLPAWMGGRADRRRRPGHPPGTRS